MLHRSGFHTEAVMRGWLSTCVFGGGIRRDRPTDLDWQNCGEHESEESKRNVGKPVIREKTGCLTRYCRGKIHFDLPQSLPSLCAIATLDHVNAPHSCLSSWELPQLQPAGLI